MVFVKKLKTLLFVSVGTLCIAQIAHADEFSERLKTDPTAVPRAGTYQRPVMDPEVTRSLSSTPGESTTPMCSYDVYYWNTIYACDPEHQGLPDQRVHSE